MRNLLLLVLNSVIFFSYNSYGMGALFHALDKTYIDPENYITEGKTSELCDQLLLLDPDSPASRPFQRDEETLAKIHQAFEREEKMLLVAEDGICNQNSYARLERIKRAHKALYSQVYEAVTNGFLNTQEKLNEETAEKLRRAQAATSNPFATDSKTAATAQPAAASSSAHGALVIANDLSPKALEEQILESNPTWTMKVANYIRKTITNPLGYLTDQKAATVADAVLLFNPQLPNRTPFNQSLPLHRELVHAAFERQNRSRDLIQYSLRRDDYETIRVLNEKIHPGFCSVLTRIIMRAYLKYAEFRKRAASQQKDPIAPIPVNIDICSCTPPKVLKNCTKCLAAAAATSSSIKPAVPPKPKPNLNNTADNDATY